MTSLNELEQTLIKDLIEQIQENDIVIQCHVEEDEPKSLEDLNKLSIEKLIEHIDIQEARLEFLIEGVTEPENQNIN